MFLKHCRFCMKITTHLCISSHRFSGTTFTQQGFKVPLTSLQIQMWNTEALYFFLLCLHVSWLFILLCSSTKWSVKNTQFCSDYVTGSKRTHAQTRDPCKEDSEFIYKKTTPGDNMYTCKRGGRGEVQGSRVREGKRGGSNRLQTFPNFSPLSTTRSYTPHTRSQAGPGKICTQKLRLETDWQKATHRF